MDIAKPLWICHTDDKGKRKGIFCLDLHPTLPLLATGSIDSTIKLWNVSQLLECPETRGQCIGTLTRHSSAVLTLRWSPSGQALASGSDDRSIIIWNANAALTAFKCTKVLAGFHSSDVTDLQWSKEGGFLVSCGVDNSICVFETDQFTLAHRIALSSIAKGMAMDPLGLFLAVQLEDSALVVRTQDWAVERAISWVSSSDTFYSRPSWSPDGTLLGCCNGEAVWLVHRETWLTDAGLSGHQGAVECNRFCPLVWAAAAGGAGEKIGIVAVGSQDGSISIWSNSSSRPLGVIWQLFSHGCLDICWSGVVEGAGGAYCSFFGCSFDGAVVQVRLNGTVLLGQEGQFQLSQSEALTAAPLIVQVPESVLEVDLLARAEKPALPSSKYTGAQGGVDKSSLLLSLKPTAELVSQGRKQLMDDSLHTLQAQRVESIAGGRKRITPIFVKALDTVEVAPAALPTALKKSLTLDLGLGLNSESTPKALALTPMLQCPLNCSRAVAGNCTISLSTGPNNSHKLTVQTRSSVLWSTGQLSMKIHNFISSSKYLMLLFEGALQLGIHSIRTGRAVLPPVTFGYSVHWASILEQKSRTLAVIVLVEGSCAFWDLGLRKALAKCTLPPGAILQNGAGVVGVEGKGEIVSFSFSLGSPRSFNLLLGTWVTAGAREKSDNSFSWATLDPSGALEGTVLDLEERLAGCLMEGKFEGYLTFTLPYLKALCASRGVGVQGKLEEFLAEFTEQLRARIQSAGVVDWQRVKDCLAIPVACGLCREVIEEIFIVLQQGQAAQR